MRLMIWKKGIQRCGIQGSEKGWLLVGRSVAVVLTIATFPLLLKAQDQGLQTSGASGSGLSTLGTSSGQSTNGLQGSNNQPNYGTTLLGSMQAQELISFLMGHPQILSAAKAQMAQALGVDVNTISDEAVYDRIRQDAVLRAKIMGTLSKMGYNLAASSSLPDQNMINQVPTPAQSSWTSQLPTVTGNQLCPAGYYPQPTYASQQGFGAPTQYGNLQMSVPQSANSTLQPYAAPGGLQPVTGSQPNPTPMMAGTAQLSAPPTSVPQTSGVPPQGYTCQPIPGAQITALQQQVQQPQVFQRQVPYEYLPSMIDLYSQFVPFDTNLKRFGSDVFLFGTGNSDTLPMDLPAGPDYVLGPGDALSVNIWGSQSQLLSVIVDRSGQIALPEAGNVMIGGMTIADAQTAIRNALHTQFRDMHVELSLGRVRTVRVYVVGDVQRPGAYDVSSLSTPLNALYAAGGPTAVGSLRTLRHYRGKQLICDIDLYDFLLHGIRSGVERILPGDTILVPPVGPQVTVNGMVRRPAIYELKGSETAKDILEMAGGVLTAASLDEISLERVEQNQRRTMLSIRLSDGGAKTSIADNMTGGGPVPPDDPSITAQLAAVEVKDGDFVLVRPILPYNEMCVFLDGHVYSPGKYPYREGMTINALLHGYKDVMPEPADHAELVRLIAPDYRPMTISLNLPDVLNGSQSIQLRPFDVVRIFSRYEIDSPTVTIVGDVIRPGEYPLAKGMTAFGLIEMAGGFRRAAYRDLADLTSYEIDGGKKVALQTSVVDLAKAQGGDKDADPALKAGDVLSIREITGWQDIGSAVTITGEVAYAGTYGVVKGERLSSVLKRAGGFLDDAYPAGADLERTEVRVMGEQARQDLMQRIRSVDLSGAVSFGSGSNAQDTAQTVQMMRSQQQEALNALESNPASGRLVIKIGEDISKWENTPADIELRAGDTISIPKRPGFVTILGQVYHQSALIFTPGKHAEWYLSRAGGATRLANKKDIYIIRADGSVVSHGSGWSNGVMSAQLQPGDALVVPEKVVGTPLWKNLFAMTQAMITPAMLGVVATR